MLPFTPGQFRVLCIEDEPEILADIVEELRDHGFAVDPASSAHDALPRIRQNAPDLIICDMQMPGMTGLELLEELRKGQDPAAQIPFVFLTAFGDRDTMISGRRAGADDYLVKPVDYDLLIAAVESHLHNAARRSQTAFGGLPGGLANEHAGGPGSLPGLAELAACLADLPQGTLVAVAEATNPAQLARRFFDRNIAFASRFMQRIDRVSGVRSFWLTAHSFAMVSNEEARLETALTRLCPEQAGRRAYAIVTGRTCASETPANFIARLAQSARLLERDGTNGIIALDGPELATMRLAESIRNALVDAIAQGELHVCFQLKLRADDSQPVAAEVLVRWESPSLGHLSPATFIPIVERAGLLPHITEWVLEQAARAQVELVRAGLPARLAVNVGAAEFNSDLPDRILAICTAHGADPALIEVEITETSLLDDPQAANTVMQRLHTNGMTVALDDFGTGFSSLSYLRSCAVDSIKIDRSFVEWITECEADQRIVAALIGLGQTLGFETVAEGVETEAQRHWLTQHGCTLLQGYLISRPLRFSEYAALLRQQLTRAA